MINYSDFEKFAHVIQHDLLEFTFKSIEGVIFCRSGSVA